MVFSAKNLFSRRNLLAGVAGISLIISTSLCCDDSDTYLAMMHDSNAPQRFSLIWENEDFDSPEGEEETKEVINPPETNTITGDAGGAVDWGSADAQTVSAWLSPYGVDLSKITNVRLKILKAAYDLLGIPYSQSRPDYQNLGKRPTLLDCSSYVWRCYAQAGLDMTGFPTNTGEYAGSSAVSRIPWSQLLPGDVLARRSGSKGHATIFLGVVGNTVYCVEETQTGDVSRIVARDISKVNASEDPNSAVDKLSAFRFQKFPAVSSGGGSSGGGSSGGGGSGGIINTANLSTGLVGGNLTAYEKSMISKVGLNVPRGASDKTTGVQCQAGKLTCEARSAIHNTSTNNYRLLNGLKCVGGLAGKTFPVEVKDNLVFVNGRIAVAIGSGFLTQQGYSVVSGYPLLIIFSDNTVVRAVMCDGKADAHTNVLASGSVDNHKFQKYDGSVVEVVVGSGIKESVSTKATLGVSKDAEVVSVVVLPMDQL